ncbi:hypothetical protein KZ877_11265, partial [Pseudomonas aeruginosa]|nr:hypothetical protein [Pseudomonas aeruginosa]
CPPKTGGHHAASRRDRGGVLARRLPQITCLQLMAKKIAVAQSTSGDVPESGLDSLNQDGDSVEMALARQLIAA